MSDNETEHHDNSADTSDISEEQRKNILSGQDDYENGRMITIRTPENGGVQVCISHTALRAIIELPLDVQEAMQEMVQEIGMDPQSFVDQSTDVSFLLEHGHHDDSQTD